MRLRPQGREGSEFSRGAANHPFDEIDAGDFLGNSVFHLQARVDFEKVKLLGDGVVNELNRSSGAVTYRATQTHRAFEHLCSHFSRADAEPASLQ